MLKLSSGGQKISVTEKTISQDNAVVDGTPNEDHSVRISRENLRLRDDLDNHKNQMDDIGISQNLKPKARANNGDVLLQNKFRKVLETEVLVYHNRDAEADRLLMGRRIVR